MNYSVIRDLQNYHPCYSRQAIILLFPATSKFSRNTATCLDLCILDA